jgi:DNA polymerase III delta subunit
MIVVSEVESVDKDLVLGYQKRGGRDCLLLVEEGAPKKNLKSLIKKLPKDVVADFRLPKPWELEDYAVSFVSQEAKAIGLKLSSVMGRALVLGVGTDLGVLSWELDKVHKLLEYEQRLDQEVQASDLKSTLTSYSEFGPFPVVDAFSRRQLKPTGKALANFYRTYSGKNKSDSVILMCSILGRTLGQWLHAKTLRSGGLSLEQTAKEMGMHSYVLKKNIIPVLSGWTEDELVSLIKKLSKVERGAKTGAMNSWSALESALFSVLR